ncbi:hypothetical protein C8J57DRAFT_1230418 [Mycena rebaudengoi]|nr:hypothetical protein C8J57DRAFT_1230418 [Mycena rebaudengoi]
MSMYQLETWASNLTEISIILALRPHWDRGPRRIKLPGIINENGDVNASCTGDLHVASVILHSCWKQGQIQAESLIPGGRETSAKCGLDKSFNILAPFGKSLVNAPDTTDAFEPEPNLFRPSPDETNAPDPEPFYDADGDIEDAMAIENPRNKNHSPHIIVDGKKLSKASILSQLMQGRDILLHVAAALNSCLHFLDLTSFPTVERMERYQYRHAGKAYFHVDPYDSESDYRRHLESQDSFLYTKCDPPVPLSSKNKQLILQHNAGHILFNPTFRRSDQPT